jgi:membrane protein implicated in regulation of membrane protease activity
MLPAAALVAVAFVWLQAHLGKSWFTLLLLLMLLAEPMLRERYVGRRKNSPHELHQRRMAIVTHACAPVGRVNLDGTSWMAKSLDDRPLESGECVYVHDGEGLLLHVSRQEPTP